jgi:hypothetical protein
MLRPKCRGIHDHILLISDLRLSPPGRLSPIRGQYAWEIVGIYRAPNEDTRVIEN